MESLIVLYITATRSVTFGYRLNINKLLYLVSSLDTNMSTRAPRVSDKIVAPMTLNYTYAYPHPHTYKTISGLNKFGLRFVASVYINTSMWMKGF